MTTDQLDLIFAPPATATTARIHCRVCERTATVLITSSGLLCDDCRRDLDATARHIAETVRLAEQATRDAYERLSADVAHADVEDQDRYGRVLGALTNVQAGAMTRAAYDARLAKTVALYPGVAALMERFEAWNGAMENLERVRGWAARGLEETQNVASVREAARC